MSRILTSEEVLRAMQDLKLPEASKESEAERSAAWSWAYGELINRISDHPFNDPEEIIRWFMTEMFIYSTMPCAIEKKVNPFLEAKELGETILLMFDCPVEE